MSEDDAGLRLFNLVGSILGVALGMYVAYFIIVVIWLIIKQVLL